MRIVLFAAVLVVLTGAMAQRLVFVSDRADALSLRQGELFLFDDGSELRLTSTPELAEFDPSPSPDGGLIAHAATSFLSGVSTFDDSWSWQYRVVDLSGRLREAWPLPGGDDSFRPAGGFAIAWLPDGRSFLAQGLDAAGNWEVHRFVLGARRTVRLAQGFGIVPSPDGSRFATSRNGIIYLVEVATGNEQVFAGGTPLGWTSDGLELLFEQNLALLRAPASDPEAVRFVGDSGPYLELRYRRDGGRYAYTTVHEGRSAVFFHDADHRYLGSFDVGGFVESFDWLDDERVVLELVLPTGARRIDVLGSDGVQLTLIDSAGDDGAPRVLP